MVRRRALGRDPFVIAVVGNPPYVRSERTAQDLDPGTAQYFEQPQAGHAGVSPKLNSYALFVYRALDSW
jgi:hypothetical protein